MMKRIVLFVALLACHHGNSLFAGDFTENLIARWTFNKPADASLIDDIKKIPIEVRALPGSSTAPQINKDGTITLGSEQFLVATGLNSDTFPELRKGVTIWVRLRVDKEDTKHPTFLYGLMAKPRGDWADGVLLLNLRGKEQPNPGMQFFGRYEGGKELAQGDKLFPDHLGEFFNSALTFDGSKEGITLNINDQEVTNKKPGASALVPFTNLSLGRVNTGPGGATITIDEIRVYSAPVSADWVKEIKPITQ